MSPDAERLLVVAGEASGDLHAARLLSELARLQPGLRTFGLGGSELRAAGLEAVADSAEVAVVGITEVLKVLPRIREVFTALLAEVDRRRPRAALLVDFPDFNLRLARRLKRRGVPVVYYISPQVWAWRRGRLRTIARRVDKMLVLFPFEVDFYRRAGVEAIHVGHPLVDEVPVLPSIWDEPPPAPEAPRAEVKLAAPEAPGARIQPAPFRVALLPGSRASEVAALLPPMLEALRLLADQVPIEASLIRAPTIPLAMLEDALAAAGASGARGQAGSAERAVPVAIVGENRFAAIAGAHVAFCASGTATLEVGLLGTPMVVVYRLAPWTYGLARLLVHLPYFSLVNLVLGRAVVPELLQKAASGPRIAAEAGRLLADRAARDRMRAELSELRGRLGAGGASARAAAEVARFLAARSPERGATSPNGPNRGASATAGERQVAGAGRENRA